MPPFREGLVKVDRKLSPELLFFLRDVGHGHRINIVDASYDIPKDSVVIDFPGTTAEAFEAVSRLIRIDGEEDSTSPVVNITEMLWDEKFDDIANKKPRPDHVAFLASKALHDSYRRLEADKVGVPHRKGLPPLLYPQESQLYSRTHKDQVTRTNEEGQGFYSIANNSEEPHTFIRTQDDLPFACVSLVVGHSQRTE
ncbi:MAG: hypothetical protein AAB395_00890 [Patescibacteria group bacterium]